MYLPLFITEKGLQLIVYETWGQSVRYFSSREDDALLPLCRAFNLQEKAPIKSVEALKFFEEAKILVTYTLLKVDGSKLERFVSSVPHLRVLTFSSTDALYEENLPEELILGILKVVAKEL